MEKTLFLLSNGFQSSTVQTHEFKNFCSIFKKELKEELKKVHATNIKISTGHFYLSGFFTLAGDRTFYFSFSDIRNFSFENNFKLLVRTAKDYNDFTGGRNQFLKIEEDMFLNNTI